MMTKTDLALKVARQEDEVLVLAPEACAPALKAAWEAAKRAQEEARLAEQQQRHAEKAAAAAAAARRFLLD